MIKLYRISSSNHIDDLYGTGARVYGGRWNHPGNPVVYSSGSRSLAALEFLVHVPMALAPTSLSITEINIQENVDRKTIGENSLPANWRDYPAPEQLANIGTTWIKSKSTLLLDVPSAVMESEVNSLINPLHPDMKFVNLVKTEKFSFDSRLFKQKKLRDNN